MSEYFVNCIKKGFLCSGWQYTLLALEKISPTPAMTNFLSSLWQNGRHNRCQDFIGKFQRTGLNFFYVPEASITHLPARGRFLICSVYRAVKYWVGDKVKWGRGWRCKLYFIARLLLYRPHITLLPSLALPPSTHTHSEVSWQTFVGPGTPPPLMYIKLPMHLFF
jgi:hypothetical protein